MRSNTSEINEMTNDKLFFSVICKKNNQTLVSDAVREIPALGSTYNAGNWVNLVSGFSVYPRLLISRSASETDDRFIPVYRTLLIIPGMTIRNNGKIFR